jgi:alkanesulfonate monooxygenase SsuD/methylene tetrahydromethanopterin reductase-like flavin-dependent oxidoreductase (luciferase family)
MTSRTPVTTAMGAATVHDLSGGRLVLGLGTGMPGPASTLERLEEYVRVVRGAMAGEEVRSETFGVEGFRSALQLGTAPPPIWLGALGDRMLDLAGRVADGVILNWCPPQRVTEARRLLKQSAERAERDPADLSVAVYVRACLGVEDKVALAALRSITGQYAALPHYRAQMDATGLGWEAEAAAAAFAAGKPNDVPEALVRALTVIGGRREAVERLESYRAAGADLVLLYPVAARGPFDSLMATMLTAAPETAPDR